MALAMHACLCLCRWWSPSCRQTVTQHPLLSDLTCCRAQGCSLLENFTMSHLSFCQTLSQLRGQWAEDQIETLTASLCASPNGPTAGSEQWPSNMCSAQTGHSVLPDVAQGEWWPNGAAESYVEGVSTCGQGTGLGQPVALDHRSAHDDLAAKEGERAIRSWWKQYYATL